jgi:hypothetical protein
MVALMFLLVVAGVFTAIIASEGHPLERRPTGLLTWIVSGNWPAKIGGGLMVVGVGALLRYAAINFAVPVEMKLGFGIAVSAALGFGSFLTAGNPQRRGISLALGGAAFGVAYLTAYSAFALFGYVPDLAGLGLLGLTAIAAGVFAVTRSALSLAVLSMVGAFIAPAFAVVDPGPRVVYSYYVAVSVLTLAMVSFRGWRPLIHLSFLFTLAGGAFFAWTADYFARGNADILFPLLAALVAVHVAMPLLERRWARGRVVESLDTVYLLALPITAALTALALSPSRRILAVELWWFAGIWSAAAAWLHVQKRDGVATHSIIALLMFGFGLAARFRNLPWELVALAIGVAALWLSSRRSTSGTLHGFLGGLVLVLAAVHIVDALGPDGGGTLFLNARFFERLVGASLLLIAARTLSRLRHTLDSLMLTVALGWTAFALGAELVRFDLVSPWLIVHWAFGVAGFALYATGRRLPRFDLLAVPLVLAIGLTGVLAQWRTQADLAWFSALFAGGALVAVALRPVGKDDGATPGRLLAAIAAPLVAALWIARVGGYTPDSHWQFPLAVATTFAAVILGLGMSAGERSRRWLDEACDIFGVGFAFVLAAAAIFDIERDASAVVLEIICVGVLVLLAVRGSRRESAARWVVPAAVIGMALVMQANLLRWLGPPGALNAFDVVKMDWPTLVSLLWASIGAGLTIWARRVGSRVQWSAGAAFLVGAAIKLLLLDFGSLGQLANILAVIAAGGVFLLVGWLAPMPPAAAKPAAPKPAPNAAPIATTPVAPAHEDGASRRLAWTIAIAAIVLLSISQCGSRLFSGGFAGSVLAPPVAVEPERPVVVRADPPPARAVERDSPWFSDCERWREAVELRGAYEIHRVDAPTIASAREHEILSVRVDRPNTAALLVLSSDRPVIWNLRAGTHSRIAGVWLLQSPEQKIAGLPANVPVLRPGWEAHANCPRLTRPDLAEHDEQVVAKLLDADNIVTRSRMSGDNFVLDLGVRPGPGDGSRDVDSDPESPSAYSAPP